MKSLFAFVEAALQHSSSGQPRARRN